EQDIEGAALEEVERFLTATAERHLVAFVPDHLGATLAQQVLIVHDEDADARLGFRGDGQQAREILGLVARGGSCDAVLCNRDGHGALSNGSYLYLRMVRARLLRRRGIKEIAHESSVFRWRARPPARTGAPTCIRTGLGIALICG